MFRNGGFFALAMLSACCAAGMSDLEALQSSATKCTYHYAYEMYGAHCVGLRLTHLPSLKGGIEILDFSDNKLQELHSDTLSPYSSLRFLYLTENQIYNIEDDAFSSLTSLQMLDLSRNVILNLPDAVLQIPSLRKLNISGNPLLHLSLSEMIISKPIRAPLEILDISDCKIKTLPDWGMLPQLTFYNISRNPLTTIEARHFALMCNLRDIDMSKSFENIPLCVLKPTVVWLHDHRVNFMMEDYSSVNSDEFITCPQSNVTVLLNSTYQHCKREYLQVQNTKTTRRTWLTICGGLAGFFVGFILLLYIMHRRNVAQTKTAAEKIQKAPVTDGDKQATAALLNNIS